MEENTQAGRSINVVAFGNTADEIELDALDKARAVFGEGVRLVIDRTYRISGMAPENPVLAATGGKTYHSRVQVNEVPS